VQQRKTARPAARRRRPSNDAVASAATAIPGQSTSLLLGYVRENARDDAVRRVSATAQHPAISAWLFAIDLFRAAFASDRVDGTPPLITPAVDLSFALRRQFLAGAARAAKPALDLILAGYYREAWALERTMLDEWAECVYLRLQPPETPLPPCEPAWREVARLGATRGDAADRAFLEEATSRWDFLTVAVRPLSGHTALTLEADPDSVAFQAAYHAEFCELALSCGLFIHCALLREVASLTEQPPQWMNWHAIFTEVVTPLYASHRGAMERWTKDRTQRCSRGRTSRH
jgi:hypothetical protein